MTPLAAPIHAGAQPLDRKCQAKSDTPPRRAVRSGCYAARRTGSGGDRRRGCQRSKSQKSPRSCLLSTRVLACSNWWAPEGVQRICSAGLPSRLRQSGGSRPQEASHAPRRWHTLRWMEAEGYVFSHIPVCRSGRVRNHCPRRRWESPRERPPSVAALVAVVAFIRNILS
jgi:hypothetical protein